MNDDMGLARRNPREVAPEKVAAFDAIDAIRAKSDKIETMNTIPADFRDDRYWA